MFELTITNNPNSAFVCSPESKYGFAMDLHESVSFSNKQFILSGIRFKDEKEDFFENEDFTIALVGKVFYRLTFSSNLDFLNAGEILNQYMLYKKAFINNLKGNFIIAIYNKKENSLLVIKDTLGLKYLYYTWENEGFFISTNLSDFKKITKRINYAAVVEKILFTYPIGEESYLEDVFMLKEGGMLHIANGKLRKDIYTSIDSLFTQQHLKKLDNHAFLDIFEKSVLQRASVSPNINVSLTGGFDGRANISVLLHHKKKIHLYSFGKQGGENTTVPSQVSKKLGLDYEPVFLDEEYENNYAQCALDSIYFSDGISHFERANYIYAMRKIANHAHYNITGLIGGEIFGPVHLKTDYINGTYFDIIYNGLDFSIDNLLVNKGIKQFISNEITGNKIIQQKIENNIEKRRELVNKWKKDKFGWLYYLKDFMSLGFRQFYGNQMHLERYFNENLSPFYDIDIIEYLFSTRHSLKYKNAFKNSPLLRRNNRKLQTLIIKRFSEELAAIPVDRGYPPVYTTDIRKLLIPFIFYKRRFRLKRSVPEFETPAWSNILYTELSRNSGIFSSELMNNDKTLRALEKYDRTDYNQTFNQMLSIAIWLNQ
jgi:asparagine synthetase B (glutamine-hydrolysing)